MFLLLLVTFQFSLIVHSYLTNNKISIGHPYIVRSMLKFMETRAVVHKKQLFQR